MSSSHSPDRPRRRLRRRPRGRQRRACCCPPRWPTGSGSRRWSTSWSTSATAPVHHRPGRKVLTLLHAMVAGGDCIDDADVLRTGSTAQVLGHRVMAPSTLGTFLRSSPSATSASSTGSPRPLLGRAWAAGGGPGPEPMTIDVDSTICEVHGHHKGGAAYGYTRQLGYHPLLATRADTGEVLHAGMRTGRPTPPAAPSGSSTSWPAGVRRAGATGQLVLRADSGFWSAKIMTACRRHGIRFSITVRQTRQVQAAIAAIPEHAWAPIDYPDGGIAQVAETSFAGWWCAAPAFRPTGHAMARLAPPRLRHRSGRWRRGSWTPTTAATPSSSSPSATSKTAPGCATALRSLPGQRRLGGHRHPGPQPAAFGRHHRA